MEFGWILTDRGKLCARRETRRYEHFVQLKTDSSDFGIIPVFRGIKELELPFWAYGAVHLEELPSLRRPNFCREWSTEN
jgi:hypothetical protein